MAKKTMTYPMPQQASVVKEPIVGFIPLVHIATPKKVSTAKYTYKEFKKVAQKIDFTQADWAALLFISERTLQRYAKTNTAFNGLQVERIILLEKMIDAGKDLFKENLVDWLKKPSIKYNGDAPFNQLTTQNGIISVIQYIGQLQWGIFV